jgi:hypothetical protein
MRANCGEPIAIVMGGWKMLKSLDCSWKTCGVSSIRELEALAPMGEAFYEERENLPGKFNPVMWVRTWWSLLELPNFVMIQLTDPEGTPMGAIGGLATPDLNTGEMVAIEQFWYVDKAARGHGMTLLRAFESWAMEQGAVRVVVGHIYDAERSEAWKKLFAMKHYTPLEIHYYKELA